MFLLSRPDLPQTPEALASAIQEGLRRIVQRSGDMVAVRGDNVRALDALEVDLSGGRIDHGRLPSRPELSDRSPALRVSALSVNATPLSVLGSELQFALKGTDVAFEQAKQRTGELLLFVQSARAGHVRIEIARGDLERLIARTAGKFAQKQGVTIESVALHLEQPQPRTLDLNVAVAGRKMFFRASLNLAGRLNIGDDLVARISNLRCSGDGAIASLVCAALTPQFARIERRAFPLSALPLGEVRLRNVAFDVSTETIAATAEFGDPVAAS